MPKPLSGLVEVSTDAFAAVDAFNPILDVDTRLFLDPKLLKHTTIPEFVESYERLRNYFGSICQLLIASDTEGDPFWRQADRLMSWREVRGLCIGYTAKGTSGSGIGPQLRRRLLATAKQIILKGIDEPELFEIVGLLEEDIGADRISDMTANVIQNELILYTNRVMSYLENNGAIVLPKDPLNQLPVNPYSNTPIILVPRSLLRDLPLALDWSEIDVISQHNSKLRNEVNDIIGDTWKQATQNTNKKSLRETMLDHPELINDLVKQYVKKSPQPYDFKNDRAGEYIWLPASLSAANKYPLRLGLSKIPSIDEVEQMVLKICDQFTRLVEDNGWEKLLYKDNGRPKHESASQLLFYGLADAYCETNGILIARESDAGRGPVDFKFGTRMENSVLVEVKKSTNTSGLTNGIKKQLPTYMKSERSKRAIYLVLDFGQSTKAAANLRALNEQINGSAIQIRMVDAKMRRSASTHV